MPLPVRLLALQPLGHGILCVFLTLAPSGPVPIPCAQGLEAQPVGVFGTATEWILPGIVDEQVRLREDRVLGRLTNSRFAWQAGVAEPASHWLTDNLPRLTQGGGGDHVHEQPTQPAAPSHHGPSSRAPGSGAPMALFQRPAHAGATAASVRGNAAAAGAATATHAATRNASPGFSGSRGAPAGSQTARSAAGAATSPGGASPTRGTRGALAHSQSMGHSGGGGGMNGRGQGVDDGIGRAAAVRPPRAATTTAASPMARPGGSVGSTQGARTALGQAPAQSLQPQPPARQAPPLLPQPQRSGRSLNVSVAVPSPAALEPGTPSPQRTPQQQQALSPQQPLQPQQSPQAGHVVSPRRQQHYPHRALLSPSNRQQQQYQLQRQPQPAQPQPQAQPRPQAQSQQQPHQHQTTGQPSLTRGSSFISRIMGARNFTQQQQQQQQQEQRQIEPEGQQQPQQQASRQQQPQQQQQSSVYAATGPSAIYAEQQLGSSALREWQPVYSGHTLSSSSSSSSSTSRTSSASERSGSSSSTESSAYYYLHHHQQQLEQQQQERYGGTSYLPPHAHSSPYAPSHLQHQQYQHRSPQQLSPPGPSPSGRRPQPLPPQPAAAALAPAAPVRYGTTLYDNAEYERDFVGGGLYGGGAESDLMDYEMDGGGMRLGHLSGGYGGAGDGGGDGGGGHGVRHSLAEARSGQNYTLWSGPPPSTGARTPSPPRRARPISGCSRGSSGESSTTTSSGGIAEDEGEDEIEEEGSWGEGMLAVELGLDAEDSAAMAFMRGAGAGGGGGGGGGAAGGGRGPGGGFGPVGHRGGGDGGGVADGGGGTGGEGEGGLGLGFVTGLDAAAVLAATILDPSWRAAPVHPLPMPPQHSLSSPQHQHQHHHHHHHHHHQLSPHSGRSPAALAGGGSRAGWGMAAGSASGSADGTEGGGMRQLSTPSQRNLRGIATEASWDERTHFGIGSGALTGLGPGPLGRGPLGGGGGGGGLGGPGPRTGPMVYVLGGGPGGGLLELPFPSNLHHQHHHHQHNHHHHQQHVSGGLGGGGAGGAAGGSGFYRGPGGSGGISPQGAAGTGAPCPVLTADPPGPYDRRRAAHLTSATRRSHPPPLSVPASSLLDMHPAPRSLSPGGLVLGGGGGGGGNPFRGPGLGMGVGGGGGAAPLDGGLPPVRQYGEGLAGVLTNHQIQEWMSQHASRLLLPRSMQDIADIVFRPPSAVPERR